MSPDAALAASNSPLFYKVPTISSKRRSFFRKPSHHAKSGLKTGTPLSKCRAPPLVNSRNQTRRAPAVGVVFLTKMRSQKGLLGSYTPEQWHEHYKSKQHTN